MYLHSSLTSVLDGDAWSTSRPGRITPPGEEPRYRLMGRGVGLNVLKNRKISRCLAGIRTPDRPGCSLGSIRTKLSRLQHYLQTNSLEIQWAASRMTHGMGWTGRYCPPHNALILRLLYEKQVAGLCFFTQQRDVISFVCTFPFQCFYQLPE